MDYTQILASNLMHTDARRESEDAYYAAFESDLTPSWPRSVMALAAPIAALTRCAARLGAGLAAGMRLSGGLRKA